MNELQIFNNPEFGEIRTLEIDNEPWFVGADVARALGYAKPQGAVARNVDAEDSRVAGVLTAGGMQQTKVINESGVYALIILSDLPSAKKFKRWVTSEVLPTIRKHGTYSIQPTSPAQLMLQQAQIIVDMEKRVAQIQADTESTRRKVDALSDNPAYWRQETNRKIKEIASQKHMAEKLFRRDLYAELERITGADLNNRLTRLRNRVKKQGALHSTCNSMTRLDVISQNKELRREFDRLLDWCDTQIERRA